MITFTIPDFEDTAPPEKVLTVSVVDDVVFIAIDHYTETFDTSATKTIAQIGVPVKALLTSLVASTVGN